MRRVLTLLAFTTVPATFVQAQDAPVRQLGRPLLEFDADFSQVTGMRELSDGRVVLLDSRERRILLLDPRTRAASAIGREGSGPGEYSRPSGLVALPGDSTLIADFGNSRYLAIGAGGRVLGTIPLLTLNPTEGVTYSVSVRAVDARGNVYFELPSGLVQDKQAGKPIVRMNRRTSRIDTVAHLRSYSVAQSPQTTVSSGGARFGMIAPTPFAASDDWVVASDGSVAVVRAQPYRIEWRQGSGSREGPVIEYNRVRVTNDDKEQWRAEARARGGPTLTTRGADGLMQTQRMTVPEPTSWPEYKPPFVSSRTMIATNGRLWVQRSVPAGHPNTEYDVFDTSGRLVEHVMMPASSSVVGFGKGVVYVVRKDDDDLLHLQRHRLD